MDSNVLQYLKDNLYLIREDEGYVVSSKLYRDTQSRVPSSTDSSNVSVDNKSSTTSNSVESTLPISLPNSKEAYKQFIVDAQIPTMINNGFGGKFFANRFSKDGYKAWKDAIEEHGVELVLAATTYYYKQHNTARVMVGNFFAQGIYESFVDDVKKSLDKRQTIDTINKDTSQRNSLRL